jgi:hypothetical protein
MQMQVYQSRSETKRAAAAEETQMVAAAECLRHFGEASVLSSSSLSAPGCDAFATQSAIHGKGCVIPQYRHTACTMLQHYRPINIPRSTHRTNPYLNHNCSATVSIEREENRFSFGENK